MRKLIAALLTAGAAISVIPVAQARDGCGAGYHRGPYGHCRPNRGDRVVAVGPRLVVGNYYRGQGYWDGHRYWRERYRWHNGWRYR